MPSISSCPECHRDLTIPEIGDPGQSLRCPLCDAEFAAERILADSVSFPPLAIVVGEAAAAPTGPAELPPQFGQETDQEAENESPASDTADQLAADLQPDTTDSTFATADDEGEIDVTIEGEETEAPPFTAGDSDLSRSERRPSEVDDELGEIAVDTGGVSHSVAPEPPSLRVAAQPRRKASGWGVLGQLIGMAAGGVVGLAIGYWILLWINPRADFLNLRGKLPTWMTPGGRRETSPWRNPSAAGPPAHGTGRSLADLLNEPESGSATDEAGESDDAFQTAEFSQVGQIDSADDPHTEAPAPNGPTPQPPLGPRDFTPHTADELQAALDAAARAVRCPYCEGKRRRCEHCRGTGVGNITVPVFERLCQLAEIATFAQFDEADTAARDEFRTAAQDLLLLIGADRDRGEVIGRLAANRLDDGQRSSNGVILAGTVAQTGYQGDLFTVRIVLSGIGRTVTVASRDSPEPLFGPRDHILILGSIVDSPSHNLAGYEGGLPQVIWGGVPFKLAGPLR
ncbi:MAG TPA: hypothetical protein VJ783_32045 [Pirellulales bacterium]|nr:hypothetical protein [Pirellulales bacterium]